MARRAEEKITLISPFVKIGALRRIVDEVREHVPMRLYTRWRPDEIAAGVSDVGAWHIIHERERSSMYLCHHLHAKCYLFDHEASVGSTNVTSRALGWHSTPNLELQVLVPASSAPVVGLLQALRRTATPVDEEIAARFEAIAAEFTEPDRDQACHPAQPSTGVWLPNTRHPADLYVAYIGRKDEVSRGGLSTIRADLDYLGIPPDLSPELFESAIVAVLAQHPFFLAIHEMSATSRRFGEYKHFVAQYLSKQGCDRDAADTWQTSLRWLLYFFSDQYEVVTPGYSEILRRRQ